ncbi:MAG: multicopper oxidase domain-containing protein [Candidatus Aenigmarchaeota archaeon]|nr:multicopper oxidase domain-containing protein [Candidatus Aenigmarchaeota archaeon]
MKPGKSVKNPALLLAALITLSLYAFFSALTEAHSGDHSMKQDHAGVVGEYTFDDFDPVSYLKNWNFNDLPEEKRKKFYKEEILADGTTLREYWIYAVDKKIEVAPGVFFDAWTYNGRVPGPTIRVTENDTVRVHFINHGSQAHTMHFHGYHEASMDGSMPEQFVEPGESFIYEFRAEPAGLHLYHCHSTPLKDHISRGLYGMFIIDPKEGRQQASELIMMMNAFDTNFDGDNEVYAANTKAFYYMDNPVKVKAGELVRIYTGNMVESDPVNSIHIHGNFFNEYRTGTLNTPNAFTDIIELGQGERSILELKFRYPGKYMFHAHQTEFSELGWAGLFEVEQ